MSIDTVSRGWSPGSQVKKPFQTGGEITGVTCCFHEDVVSSGRILREGRVGGPSPQVLQLVLSHFAGEETRTQTDGLTFQCHLISKWQSQDLNLAVSDSEFNKYVPYATLSLSYCIPHTQH